MRINMVRFEDIEHSGSARVEELVMNVPGFLLPMEARCLYSLACKAKGWIVELGSWQGRSTAALCAGARLSGAKVACVDAFIEPANVRYSPSNAAQLLSNLMELGLKPDLLMPSTTRDAARVFVDRIDVLFIDANHEEACVYEDAILWSDKVRPGGIVVFHDYAHPKWPGVRKAVDRWNNNADFQMLLVVDRLAIF